jgi:hypothetical protein
MALKFGLVRSRSNFAALVFVDAFRRQSCLRRCIHLHHGVRPGPAVVAVRSYLGLNPLKHQLFGSGFPEVGHDLGICLIHSPVAGYRASAGRGYASTGTFVLPTGNTSKTAVAIGG